MQMHADGFRKRCHSNTRRSQKTPQAFVFAEISGSCVPPRPRKMRSTPTQTGFIWIRSKRVLVDTDNCSCTMTDHPPGFSLACVRHPVASQSRGSALVSHSTTQRGFLKTHFLRPSLDSDQIRIKERTHWNPLSPVRGLLGRGGTGRRNPAHARTCPGGAGAALVFTKWMSGLLCSTPLL